ncbi:MAG: methionyl-tRNA formyltransferase [Alphaproteobacteria bacterium]|nr:methionyl-tRNA formyltransferase [Alphaproteobacteria bacterium]MBU0792689.1 methionyl-tRNA formyltransferase [Alphaproteobacteria bacterium]MBU0877306.1 methionyl-tRNA formyltransferase [Alphaproteobacteria bacterium]MBU1770519.1 methionyl-tRNA formyltransferase [Alphaproteobacteria bacterium]
MRIIFMGTPDFAVPTLDALVAAGHEIAAVYTQPPRPAGRGKAPRPSPIQARAEALGLAIRSPLTLREEAEQAAFDALEADVAVVAAYGLILPVAVLHAPRLGSLNVHASLLPRWRGAAPIQRAILAGDAETGVTIMAMAKGLDTGPMLAKVSTPTDNKTAGALTEELAHAGAALMIKVLSDIGAYRPRVQPEAGVNYAAKIDKAESHIDFSAGPVQAERQVRAFNPAPGAWFSHKGERFKVLAADIDPRPGAPGTVLDDGLLIGCGEQGSLRPTLIQRAGKGAMPTEELLRGFPIPAGTVLE